MAPVGIIDPQVFDERGYVTAADALNQFTSNTPELNQARATANPAAAGSNPNLFGLGSGRTLTRRGTAAGLILAAGASAAFGLLAPDLPRLSDIAIDGRVVRTRWARPSSLRCCSA